MGCCGSSESPAAEQPAAGTAAGAVGGGDLSIPTSPSLFEELAIPVFRRPSVELLRLLWDTHDDDQNDELSREAFHEFLKAVSQNWGDGTWAYKHLVSANAYGGAAEETRTETKVEDATHHHHALLSADRAHWPEVILAFWGPPVFGMPSSVVVLFKRHFVRVAGGSDRPLGSDDAARLAREVLDSVHVPKREKDALAQSITTVITFEQFVKHVGPTYAKYSNEKVGIRHGGVEGDLPLDGTVRGFAPIREGAECQILNCGEATLTAMLYAIKGAKSEIMMSFWEFCPTYPAIRNAQLGNDAWKDKSGGTLPPILKQKAEAGCKVYILLYDIVDNLNKTAPVVEYAMKSLGGAHPNIHVVKHPGLTVWTKSHHQKFVVADRTVAVLGGIDWTVGRWDTPNHPLFDFDSSVRPGIDMIGGYPRYQKSVSEWWEKPERDTGDRRETAVGTWQDVSVRVTGKAADDVAKNFLDRWEFVRGDVVELIGDGLRDGMPSIPQSINVPSPTAGTYEPSGESIRSLTAGGYPSSNSSSGCKCQIVRSLGNWSGGLKSPEISHYQAWISAINSARSFVYVEQQYFIANMGEVNARNRLAEAILNSVTRAVEENRAFRVYIVIPEAVDLDPISYYTRRTLIQDSQSDKRELCLMSRVGKVLKKAKPGSYWDGATAESVMSVCSLNKVEKSASGRWEYDDIFVHSKVLVVDDKIAVIGSANANDRSFVGNSDSELGAIIWSDDLDAASSSVVGPVKDFRLRLWRQYLGLSPDGTDDGGIVDASSKEAFELWTDTATQNQEIISSVFEFTPRDTITSMREYKKLKRLYKKKAPAERAASLVDPDRLKDVKGQLVVFPPKFLSDQCKKSFLTDLSDLLPFLQSGFL